MSHFTKNKGQSLDIVLPERFVNKHFQKKHTTKASRHTHLFQTCPNKACWSRFSRDVAYITYEYLSSIFNWLVVLTILKNSQLGRIIPIMENKGHVPNHQPDDFHHLPIGFPATWSARHGPALSCFLQRSEHRREGNDICTALPRYDLCSGGRRRPRRPRRRAPEIWRWQQKQQTKRGLMMDWWLFM